MRSLVFSILLLTPTAFGAGLKPIDYKTLDFTLTLQALRAGNHDESGTNQYFFETILYGLPVLKDEVNKPFEERKKSVASLGKFAELQIDSLKYWSPDKKPHGTQLSVPGDKLRSLVAEVMRTQSVPEDQTSIRAVVTLYEMNKKFGWLGHDTKVSETSFDLIPESLPRIAKTEDKTLTITDDQGTYVEIKLEFKLNVVKKEDVTP